jgi:hypothetical protein
LISRVAGGSLLRSCYLWLLLLLLLLPSELWHRLSTDRLLLASKWLWLSGELLWRLSSKLLWLSSQLLWLLSGKLLWLSGKLLWLSGELLWLSGELLSSKLLWLLLLASKLLLPRKLLLARKLLLPSKLLLWGHLSRDELWIGGLAGETAVHGHPVPVHAG